MVAFSLPALGATLLPFAGAIPGSMITRKNRVSRACFYLMSFCRGEGWVGYIPETHIFVK